jgi:hypothetical protein
MQTHKECGTFVHSREWNRVVEKGEFMIVRERKKKIGRE